MARLDQICTLNMGQSPDSSTYNEVGDGIPFFQGNADFGNLHPKVRVWCSAPTKIARTGDVLISVRAPIGALNIADRECCIGRGLAALTVNEELCIKDYLWHAIASKVDELNNKGTGSTFKAISKSMLAETDIPLPSLAKQLKIAEELTTVDKMIALRKEQLAKLDQLVKSRFIELYGDPEHNEEAIPTLPMTELCEIIDGDRGTNYPKQEEFSGNGFCLFLNAKNVTANGFSFENCMFITAEKDKLLRKGKLSRGDVVLTTRGTIGNLAFYDGSVPYEHIRINSGMVILRMKRERITERFFIEQFKMQLASIKEKIASGSAQPQLPISTMNKIVMLVPDVDLQHQFAAFVEQVDKSKLAIQQSLDNLELLKKSLMQEYFG